jgi:ABC-2 type transport system ATP-binding protein
MIEALDLSRRYGDVLAVDHVTFTVRPGHVTGFLGPNGAGKSTTMRMILGLDQPDTGSVRINGQPYQQLARPLREIGALLDAGAVDGGRRGRDHLRWLAASNDIPARRVDEVLDLVDLTDAGHRRVGQYSLGMRQRLGIGAALLGDPPVLMLDEPINGLDPDGIVWLRHLVRDLAQQGRTILLSSHLMTETAHVADHVVVIRAGRIVADADVDTLLAGHAGTVLVRAERQHELDDAITRFGATTAADPVGGLVVTGMDARTIGQLAASAGIALSELTPRTTSLEDVFFELTDHPDPSAHPSDDLVTASKGS